MRSTMSLTLLAALACAALASDGWAQAEPQPPPDKEAVREIVREYLLEHPEVIEEAILALNAKRQAAKAARARDALMENRAALVGHPMSPVSGNPEGDVTLVEFFDYQCGHCKRSLAPVMDLLKSDPGAADRVEGFSDTRAGLELRRARGHGGAQAGQVSGVPRGGHGGAGSPQRGLGDGDRGAGRTRH